MRHTTHRMAPHSRHRTAWASGRPCSLMLQSSLSTVSWAVATNLVGAAASTVTPTLEQSVR